ncbi:glycoside hydrolase superfamily [Mycena albidolilacea]|uniref:Glycoside hydrolase superfamily n=1 Tax=Mycena albidolilacea TaxID=1033008 RepID=A0AAD7ENQ3_9AGAR|nr:glycoside hydrolase superfamily [Mycena albidolilacea]
MAGRVSVAAETNSAALSAQAIVAPKRNVGRMLFRKISNARSMFAVVSLGSVAPQPILAGMDASRDALQCLFLRAISAETLTHINLAFTLISSSFNIVEMTNGDSDLWKRTTALKKRNPTLKDPPTQKIFSNMVESDANTKTFISSVLKGLDVDWEYPAADDRSGIAADTKNYVTCMADLKWYLQHLDMPGLLKSADWVNVMTYDLHGKG